LRCIVVGLSFSPVGSCNKASLAIDALPDGEAAALTRKPGALAAFGARMLFTLVEVLIFALVLSVLSWRRPDTPLPMLLARDKLIGFVEQPLRRAQAKRIKAASVGAPPSYQAETAQPLGL
jgi:hypothetical protein